MIFVAFGGSGTCYLGRKLRIHGGEYHSRADAQFKPMFWPTQGGQKLDDMGYKNYPVTSAINSFFNSTKFKFNKKKDINENMIDYVNYIKSKKINSLLTMASYYKFFSSNKISNVCFLVRHPLHQYGSWFKKKRHGSHLKSFGGKDDKRSISYFATVWNSFVQEYIDLKNDGLSPIIMRYEYIDKDVKNVKSKLMKKCFNGWNTSRRNVNFINKEMEENMKDMVKDVFFKVYDAWEI